MDHADGESRRPQVLTRRPVLFGGLMGLVALLLGIAGIGALFANPIVTVQLQASDDPIVEGDSGSRVVNFSVRLSQALGPGQQIVVAMSTDVAPSNPATINVDYAATPATLTFGPGDVALNFPVTIIGDTVDELNEAFIVRATVTGATGAPEVQPPVGSSTETLAVIVDDDNPTVQSISAPTVREGPGAALNFVVTLNRPGIPGENITIGYFTQNGTATSPADFAGVSAGTLIIPAGQPSGTIQIPVVNDGIPEGPETMTLVLNPATSFSVNTPFNQSSATGTILDPKAPPVMNDQTFSVAENSPNGTPVGTLVVTDEEPANLTFSITGGTGAALFAVASPSGQITVAGALDYETATSYTLQVQVCDISSQCDDATITINLTNVNDEPPVVTPGQTFSVAENSPLGTAVGTVAVTDPDGPAATRAFAITVPAGAPFAIASPGGEISVAGPLDFETTPSYTLTVQVCDGGSPNLCSTGTVTVNVTDANDAPVVDLNGAAPGVDDAATYTEQAPPARIVGDAATVTDPDTTPPNNQIATLVATITDPRNGAAERLSVDTSGVSGVSATYNPTTGALTITGPASTADMTTVLRTLRYENTSNNPGTARRIEVVATDGGGLRSPAAVITLTITPVDDPPELVNNGLIVGEGQSAPISAAALQASDPDTEPEDLRFTLTALPARGTLRLGGVLVTGGSFTQADINAGRLVYTHDGSETTSDSFRFTVSDGSTTLPEATFNITITPENDNPVVVTSAGATPYLQGQPPVVIDPGVTVTDADTPAFNGGSLSVALTGGALEDELGVLNQGDAPGQISSSGGVVRYGGVAIGSLSVGSGGPLVVLFNANATPEAVQALARAITFANTATVTASGPRTATFIISDGAGGNSDPATKVVDINLLPIAVNDSPRVWINTPTRILVLANDSDPDGDPLTITEVSTPGRGSVRIIDNGRALRYTPEAGYRGPDSFTYTISDGRGGTATATVSFTVDLARIWLPIANDRPVEPDLVVDFRLVPERPRAFMPARVEVTVTNRGRGPASNFWVDFYVNPREAPMVNQPWNELCRDRNCRGIAWFYEGTLRPGESVTFTSTPQSASNPNGYQPRYTIWDGFFENGSYSLYAYVDSWNRDSSGAARNPRGAIAEENEDNNRAERQVTVEVDR